jgi:hypothetical protein
MTGQWVVAPIVVKEIIYELLLFGACSAFVVVAFSIVEERMRLNQIELKLKIDTNNRLLETAFLLEKEKSELKQKTEIMDDVCVIGVDTSTMAKDCR